MGSQESIQKRREEQLDENVFEKRSIIVKSWRPSYIKQLIPNQDQHDSDSSTLDQFTIERAAQFFSDYLSELGLNSLRVLEVMSGNCCASFSFLNKIQEISPDLLSNWIASDIVHYQLCEDVNGIKNFKFVRYNTVDAVKRYGQTADLLLIISPMPSGEIDDPDEYGGFGFADIFAYDDFIKQTVIGKTKYIVVIGELGVSDGSPGSYYYLHNHPYLTCVYRKIILKGRNRYDGLVIKEIFIFEVKKEG